MTLQKPNIDTLEIDNKPTPNNGKNYPLRDLKHRDFELLMYCIYNQDILSKKVEYDDVALMSGVRDKAQDCILYKNNIKVGLIQCKHSENDTPLTVKTSVEEIIKFLLYSIKETDLLPNIDTYTYYFASSSGFNTEADNYLRTFSSKIKNEKNIEKWTQNVIKNYSTLGLVYDDIVDNLKAKLKKLKVVVIIPDDIQNKLIEYESLIAKRFFNVRMVFDSEDIDQKIEKHIKNSKNNKISIDKIIAEYRSASIFLSNYKSVFSLLNPQRIERKSTNEIKTWINNPLKNKESNVGILKGGAGSGKSVILNNLFNLLSNDNIPVIAFKADEKNAITIKELEQKLNLSIPLEESVLMLAGNFQKVVVIIDQIDALSQTLSSNRDLLGTYLILIEKLRNKENIRVIISAREFDLNYDPYLIPLKDNTSFDAGKLEKEDVINILKNLKVIDYSEKLIKFLQTPLNLELFCKVYSNKKKFIKFFSLNDLYNELWNIKIAKLKPKETKSSIINTLYSIATKIYEQQEDLSVSTHLFELEDVEYLQTEGLIFVNESNRLVFFHQTFYDYVFAKQFVENNKDIIEYLIENNQGLFIRSSLKIILVHLREQSPTIYKELIIKLLDRADIRFHIKQLVVNYLGFIQEPNYDEKDIIDKCLINTQYEVLFIESINTQEWVEHFIIKGWTNKYFNTYLEELNVVSQLFLRNLNLATNNILEYLDKFENNDTTDNFISRILYFLKTWNETAIQLYYKIELKAINDSYLFCHCIEHAVINFEDWAFAEFEKYLLLKIEGLKSVFDKFKVSYNELELLKKLYNISFSKSFKLNQIIIENVINKTAGITTEGKLIIDGTFWFHSKNDNLYERYDLLNLFIQSVENIAIEDSIQFNELITRYSDSKYVTLLRVLIFGYIKNPKLYYDQALTTIFNIYNVNNFLYNDSLLFYVRELITQIYPFLSYNQKNKLNSILLSINDSSENEVYIHPVSKKKTYRNFKGYLKYKFLQSIPQQEILSFPIIKNEILMLHRRFGKVKDKEPNTIITRGVPAPYNKENYSKMTLEDWLNTFIKFNDEYNPDFFSGGGSKLEHSRAFEKEVENQPDFFFPLLEKIVFNDKVSPDYLTHGISGLVKAQYDIDKVNKLIVKQIKYKLNNENVLYTIWNTEYIIKNNRITKPIFDFLCYQALNNSSPQKDTIKNPMQLSINSVRGAAIDRIIRLQDKRYGNRIFDLLKTVILKEKKYAIKATIIHNSAYLLFYNKIKAFNLFIELIKIDKRLINESFWSANYFANSFFSEMNDYIKLAMKNKSTYKEYGNFLAISWLKGFDSSEKYLFNLLRKDTEARSEVIRIAMHPKNLINEDKTLNQKCAKLFNYLLHSKDEKVIQQYSVAFLHLDAEVFQIIFPLLKNYSTSNVFFSSPEYFCKYIVKSCRKETVHKCFELISRFDKLQKSDISRSNYYDNEPINTILSIYNTLSKSDYKLKSDCMNMFDKMLQQPQHRDAAYKATALAEI
jgi:hypothetical protein